MRGKYTWDKHRIRACFEGVAQIVQFRAMEVLLGPKPKRKATDMEEDAELEEIFEEERQRDLLHHTKVLKGDFEGAVDDIDQTKILKEGLYRIR